MMMKTASLKARLPSAFQRIGLWISATGGASSIAGSIIGEAGSSIRVDGNGARGVQIDQALAVILISQRCSQSAKWRHFGDNSVGVEINENIEVITGSAALLMCAVKHVVGIDIDANIGGASIVETGVNATGYSTTPEGSPVDRSGWGQFFK